MIDRIDHTLLKPTTVINDIYCLVDEAYKHNFRAICIPPTFVKTVSGRFPELDVVTVIGFPLGYHTKCGLWNESMCAIQDGADELDIVWDHGLFKERRYLKLVENLTSIVNIDSNVAVKVIVEECYLGHDEKKTAFKIVDDCGAYAIKTSTGFGPSGAAIETVRLWNALRNNNDSKLFIKAAGGIKTLKQVEVFIDAGADIIGTTNSVNIAREYNEGRFIC